MNFELRTDVMLELLKFKTKSRMHSRKHTNVNIG